MSGEQNDRYALLREEYEGLGLDGVNDASPWPLFDRWQSDAESAGLPLANAMSLATASADGAPSVRMVLLKHIDERQRLWFFTDYGSRKGADLAANPQAALLFYWQPLHRQVRIRGRVEKLIAAESDAYFLARPRASSLSAMASKQSEVVAGHKQLEESRAALEAEFAGRELERPERWGGFAITASSFEFWQGRPDRLHHRLLYALEGAGWARRWLAP